MMIQPTRPRPVAVISTGTTEPNAVPCSVVSWARTVTTPLDVVDGEMLTVRCSPGPRVTRSEGATRIRLGESLTNCTRTFTVMGSGLLIVTGKLLVSDPITNWLAALNRIADGASSDEIHRLLLGVESAVEGPRSDGCVQGRAVGSCQLFQELGGVKDALYLGTQLGPRCGLLLWYLVAGLAAGFRERGGGFGACQELCTSDVLGLSDHVDRRVSSQQSLGQATS